VAILFPDIDIFLKFENGRVKEASYLTDGCGSSLICGSFAAELTMGKTPDDLADITGDAILKKIGKFPKEDAHCADLAAETLQAALQEYTIRQTGRP
jgi:nitrogen fixation protein NifU and related proteins